MTDVKTEDKARWLAEKFQERFGRKPSIGDVIEQGDICVRTGRHLFDTMTDLCVRCAKSASSVEDRRE